MNIFQSIVAPKPKRSTFDMSHDVKLTTEFGRLTPIMCEEVMPNDTWQVSTDVLVRFAPLIAPVLEHMQVTVDYFYVPFRLVWDDFEKFITGENEAQSPPKNPPTLPRLRLLDGREGSDFFDANGQWTHGSLADYLNFPTSEEVREGGGMYVSALPFRAYQLIWNEYYRDENLQEDLNLDTQSGLYQPTDAEYTKLLTIRNRAWSKDYFTSALPFTQKGPQAVVPVFGEGIIAEGSHPTFTRFVDGTHPGASDKLYYGVSSEQNPLGSSKDLLFTNFMKDNDPSSPSPSGGLAAGNVAFSSSGFTGSVNLDNSRHLDLSGIQVLLNDLGYTINDLRRANAIQRWFERNARGGSRYIESLLNHFGVISDDLRLQRPEFLTRCKAPVEVSDVLQTSQSTTGEGGSPLAQYSGYARSYNKASGFRRTFKERGYVIGLLSISCKATYMEGLPRAYRRFDKFDFAFPEFSRLGEQEVFNWELALRGENHQDTFGYQSRYADYKTIPSRLHGDFKNINGLGYWTLARHYAEQPALTGDFVECDAAKDDLNRIFAVKGVPGVNDDHHFIQVHNTVSCRRCLPYLPEPSL